MPRRTPAALCAALATLFQLATPCPSYAWLEGPEPAYLGLITKHAERDTFAYDLLNDPDVVGPEPVCSTESGYIGPVFTEEEKNSWACRMLPNWGLAETGTRALSAVLGSGGTQ